MLMNVCDHLRLGRGLARWGFCGILACSAGLGLGAAEKIPARSPEEALRSFQVEPGLRVELVAAEPLVVGPVAFAFDERRRLYVVEGRGYPDPVDGSTAPAEGRIALLEDRDGDGRYETRTEFATGLSYPNGILPWQGGVFVTCAPDVYYLKDTNGDGIADEKRVVLTGFNKSRTAQIRVSHPTLGLDGKIYLTSGLNGGTVTIPSRPDVPAVSFATSDSRFDPRTLDFELTGGRAQFGLSFDGFGRKFIVANRHPVMQVVLEPWYMKRNPHLAFADMVQNVSKVESEGKVWPISRASVSADFIPSLMSKPHAGTFTSACATVVYGGTALGADHTGNVFICEPAQNLVQRQALLAEGASFRSDVVNGGREFLASTDVWFRPVFLGEGPDGALYVADMYRREIDHPSYVPEESRGKLDFVSGKDRGRIYRIVRENAPVRAKPPGTTTPELVRSLDAPEGWWRELAQRLLVERAEVSAVPAIEKIAATGSSPEGRTRALWTLQGLGQLQPKYVLGALKDPSPGVREQGVRLGAELMTGNPEIAAALLAVAADENARVRFCAALALGSWSDPRAVAPLAAIAARDGADRWTRAAVLSGIGSRLDAFRAAFVRWQDEPTPAVAAVMEDLGRMLGTGASLAANGEFLKLALQSSPQTPWRLPAVLGLAEGLRTRAEFRGKAADVPLVAALGKEPGASRQVLADYFQWAAGLALDERTPVTVRSPAVALLGYAEFARGVARLGPLLDARQPAELQLQVVRALERVGDPRGGDLLVQAQYWNRYTPQIREAVIAALTSKPALIKVLFAAIKRGDIKAPEISSIRRGQLQKHANSDLAKEAKELFQTLEAGDRMAVYRSLRDLVQGPADAVAGAPVFVRACSACHTHKGAGGKVGPDLTGVRNQPADALLLHILVPNYEVAPAYQTLTVVTQDGRTISGWLAAESDSSLQLRTAAGTEETVLRKNVASLAASGLSLMPDGLEQTMTKAELANLVAFLKSEN